MTKVYENVIPCPHCGGRIATVEETIPARSSVVVMRRDDGTIDLDFPGDTEICWEGCEVATDGEGDMMFTCENNCNVSENDIKLSDNIFKTEN